MPLGRDGVLIAVMSAVDLREDARSDFWAGVALLRRAETRRGARLLLLLLLGVLLLHLLLHLMLLLLLHCCCCILLPLRCRAPVAPVRETCMFLMSLRLSLYERLEEGGALYAATRSRVASLLGGVQSFSSQKWEQHSASESVHEMPFECLCNQNIGGRVVQGVKTMWGEHSWGDGCWCFGRAQVSAI